MTEPTTALQGLNSSEAKKLQEQYGKNELTPAQKPNFFKKALHIISEPMFMLLIVAAIIYFILGEPRDGAIMLVFVLGIIGIDVIQEWKTDKTLNALRELSAPQITVVRDGKETKIASIDLVPGDVMLIAEGVKIPADGRIIRANDLCVDESSLTGESVGVWKTALPQKETEFWRKDYCYAGTLVTQGSAAVLVEKIGPATAYGKIGSSVLAAPEIITPLQKQTNNLVKWCAAIAAALFVLVVIITYFNIPDHRLGERIIESILSGITLAMAMIPEEFPVILTVFLSLGAWRLAKKSSLVRKLPAVETLGAVSVLCVDKTGTITMNKMSVRDTWAVNCTEAELCEIMGLGCETDTYDPMEKAMLNHCEAQGISKDHLFGGRLITEYPLTHETPMMGHVWRHDGEILIAAKGSPEKILAICTLSKAEKAQAEAKMFAMSAQGLRVIAVGIMYLDNEAEIPQTIMECKLTLCGLIGLADPPRENIKADIEQCTQAGIRIIMITGDNGITASSIAKQTGIPNSENIVTGDELNHMTDEELCEKVKQVSIFSRVMPKHKMRIVKALQTNDEIVAMTGDGVNDAPALKHADIGIAMGKRGSEVSREAADLVLLDDNFSTIVDTVKDGRRIYDNIRKAIGYVFTIHIPIAFASLLAPLLNIAPMALMLLPLHIVLLELIIDPTCSIVLERQPAEKDIMQKPPRNPKATILNAAILGKSLLQGIVIFAASFGVYYSFLMQNPAEAAVARTMGLVIIIFANLFLVHVNSSNTDFAIISAKRLAKDKLMWLVWSISISGVFLIVYTPLANFLKLAPLAADELFMSFAIAAAAVFWYELVKLGKKLWGKSKQLA